MRSTAGGGRCGGGTPRSSTRQQPLITSATVSVRRTRKLQRCNLSSSMPQPSRHPPKTPHARMQFGFARPYDAAPVQPNSSITHCFDGCFILPTSVSTYLSLLLCLPFATFGTRTTHSLRITRLTKERLYRETFGSASDAYRKEVSDGPIGTNQTVALSWRARQPLLATAFGAATVSSRQLEHFSSARRGAATSTIVVVVLSTSGAGAPALASYVPRRAAGSSIGAAARNLFLCARRKGAGPNANNRRGSGR